MVSKFKVGVIGTGGISRTHMPGWAASPHAEVVAGADVNADILAEWGNLYGINRLSTDPADLLADPEISIIDICTPNMYHTELVVAALNAGKHVICEKPLAVTPDEIRRMIAARDAAGRELMTAQHHRFSGISQAVKREVETGVLGNVYHARGWMLRRSAYIPTPTFVYRRHAGGGALIDIGVHILDLTLWLMGNPEPVSVSGVTRTELARREGAFSVWHPGAMPQDMDVEEFAAAFVRFANGATLILEVSWVLHHDTPVEDMQLWLYGSEGGLRWPSGQFLATNYETQQHYNKTLVSGPELMEPHAFECFEFARALAEGRPSPVPAEQSLQVSVILDAIYRSQSTGREVRLDEE
jgi:predicted dehydrogenase